MIERVSPDDLVKVEPEVVGCSWLPDREFMGRGRASYVRLDRGKLDLGIVRDTTANDEHLRGLRDDDAAGGAGLARDDGADEADRQGNGCSSRDSGHRRRCVRIS